MIATPTKEPSTAEWNQENTAPPSPMYRTWEDIDNLIMMVRKSTLFAQSISNIRSSELVIILQQLAAARIRETEIQIHVSKLSQDMAMQLAKLTKIQLITATANAPSSIAQSFDDPPREEPQGLPYPEISLDECTVGTLACD